MKGPGRGTPLSSSPESSGFTCVFVGMASRRGPFPGRWLCVSAWLPFRGSLCLRGCASRCCLLSLRVIPSSISVYRGDTEVGVCHHGCQDARCGLCVTVPLRYVTKQIIDRSLPCLAVTTSVYQCVLLCGTACLCPPVLAYPFPCVG